MTQHPPDYWKSGRLGLESSNFHVNPLFLSFLGGPHLLFSNKTIDLVPNRTIKDSPLTRRHR